MYGNHDITYVGMQFVQYFLHSCMIFNHRNGANCASLFFFYRLVQKFETKVVVVEWEFDLGEQKPNNLK